MIYYQGDYGFRATSNWGEGDTLSEYALGDIVWIPADSPAVKKKRVDRPGLHRVHSVFSIDEGPWFYYRVSPMVTTGRGDRLKTLWEECSDRLHVLPNVDYTTGWVRVHEAAAA